MKVEIVNRALQMLGQPPISSLDDEVVTAVIMKELYEPAKRQVLRMYEWNCALREEALVEEDCCHPCWDYCYSHPEDSERIIKVIESKEAEATVYAYSMVIGSDATFYGFGDGTAPFPEIGSMTPAVFEGATIHFIASSVDSIDIPAIILSSDVADTIRLTMEGFDDAVIFSDVGGSGAYTGLENSDFEVYLTANVGSTVGVNLVSI